MRGNTDNLTLSILKFSTYQNIALKINKQIMDCKKTFSIHVSLTDHI